MSQKLKIMQIMSILKTLMKIMNNVSNHTPENGHIDIDIFQIVLIDIDIDTFQISLSIFSKFSYRYFSIPIFSK